MNICSKTIENAKDQLESRFKSVIDNSRSKLAKLDLNKITLNDKYHNNLNTLNDKLTRLINISDNQINSDIKAPNCSPRNQDCHFPNTNYLKSNSCTITALYDIEVWVENIRFIEFNYYWSVFITQFDELNG